MDPSFDDDTALEPIGPGRWRGIISRRWYAAIGVNGGLIAAHATRAMMLAAGADRAPRSLTLHYLKAPTEGPIDYELTVERAGRSVTFVSLRGRRGDDVLITGVGVLAVDADGPGALVQPATGFPQAPPPAGLTRVRPGGSTSALLDNYDLRHAFGAEPVTGAEESLVGGWIRTIAPRPLDAIALAAYSDAWWPAVFPRLDGPALMPTLDLTIHWRAPVPDGEHPWVLCRLDTREAGGGIFDEQGELWSADGRLLLQSRQLALLRPMPGARPA
ncbi:hypothetical protein DSM112329_05357 [Paraconexibacter sp. AEG42_29]|uniref:Thioesterase family protein n=1 Tax=Paraconexibacter sp. AEG42_29 TaxID=2997339 RepID=A0AAU7B370_9ACTN